MFRGLRLSVDKTSQAFAPWRRGFDNASAGFKWVTIISPKASPVLMRKRKQLTHFSSSTGDYGIQIPLSSRAIFATHAS
jgi:hypothetical protein